MIVSSNKPFSPWTELFGDAVPAIVDRLAHQAEIIILRGDDSYRLQDNDQTRGIVQKKRQAAIRPRRCHQPLRELFCAASSPFQLPIANGQTCRSP